MAQDYPSIDASHTLQDSRAKILARDEALRSNFSGNTAPSGPTEGQIWWDEDDDLLYVYNGADWKEIGQKELLEALFLQREVASLDGTTQDFAGVEIRESGKLGAQTEGYAKSPKLGMFWSGRNGSVISFRDQLAGALVHYKYNDVNTWYPFLAKNTCMGYAKINIYNHTIVGTAFNVSSVALVGSTRIYWDKDFSDSDYVVVTGLYHQWQAYARVSAQTTSYCDIQILDSANNNPISTQTTTRLFVAAFGKNIVL